MIKLYTCVRTFEHDREMRYRETFPHDIQEISENNFLKIMGNGFWVLIAISVLYKNENKICMICINIIYEYTK